MRRELSESPGDPRLDELVEAVSPLRKEIVEHELYARIDSMEALRTFMEHHVFAVWDFMSLLKALQRARTCVETPWVPRGDGLGRHLINEIVLEEEADRTPDGGYASHFEMYREAMARVGASTRAIDGVVAAVEGGASVERALADDAVPGAAASFVEATFDEIRTGASHRIVAAFTLGREDLVPEMFHSHVRSLHRTTEALDLYVYYLERHMQLDEEEHGPMALRMLVEVCGEDPDRWREAREAAERALRARRDLWDAIVAALD